MSTIPSFQVFTSKKLLNNPNQQKRVSRRLGYRTFRESELQQLDEVLHEASIDLEGKLM